VIGEKADDGPVRAAALDPCICDEPAVAVAVLGETVVRAVADRDGQLIPCAWRPAEEPAVAFGRDVMDAGEGVDPAEVGRRDDGIVLAVRPVGAPGRVRERANALAVDGELSTCLQHRVHVGASHRFPESTLGGEEAVSPLRSR